MRQFLYVLKPPGIPAVSMLGPVVRKGDVVTDFELPDETGAPRRLSGLLADGPVVQVLLSRGHEPWLHCGELSLPRSDRRVQGSWGSARRHQRRQGGAAAALCRETFTGLSTAGSTGRRNTGIKSLCWGFKLQGLTWSFVELTSHFVQIGLRMHRQVGAFRKVLSQQTIGVLIRAALPRALRVAEVDIDVSRQGKSSMIRKLLAPVPSQRFVQLSW